MKSIILAFACLIASSHCASHDVEWIYGMTENELCVAPGDTVNFVYESNHNVEVTSQEAYEACTVTMPDPVPGPIAWTAPMEEGVTYTLCGVRTHCADGNQKLAITVSGSC